jgi:hypothetical protein
MKPVTDMITGSMARLAEMCLPERTKRLMFLASFSGQLKDPTEMSNELLHKLNKVLSLSVDDAALRFPVHLSHAIWRNRPLEPGVKQSLKMEGIHDRAHAVSRKIIAAMPSWLRYGDEAEMSKDVEDLLRNWQHVGV